MMKAYTIIKQEIEALFGVQGVILRIYEGEVQYIVAFADFKKIGQLREIIPVADGLFRQAGRDLYLLSC